MASAAYLAACKTTLERLVSTKTLQELSNQRKGEVGQSVSGVVDAVLEEAILLAAAEIEDELGAGEVTDYRHIKFTVTLAIHDLAKTYSLNISDTSIVSRQELSAQIAQAKVTRRQRQDTFKTDDKDTGWKKPPSGHDPFSNIG